MVHPDEGDEAEAGVPMPSHPKRGFTTIAVVLKQAPDTDSPVPTGMTER